MAFAKFIHERVMRRLKRNIRREARAGCTLFMTTLTIEDIYLAKTTDAAEYRSMCRYISDALPCEFVVFDTRWMAEYVRARKGCPPVVRLTCQGSVPAFTPRRSSVARSIQ